jgi:hypothetical protein
MRYYCILYIRTNEAKPLAEMLGSKRVSFETTDRDSPDEKASIERLKKAGLVHQRPYRYYSTLSSRDRVKGPAVLEHIKWLFSNLKPTFNLSELEATGAEYGLSFFWEGSGTGGGPTITSELAELLLLHKINLDFGFYFAPAET